MDASRRMSLSGSSSAGSVGSARGKSLKRTISKCGIDAGMFGGGDGGMIAPKKLAPLQEPHRAPHANDVYVDDDEPVLLPRHLPKYAPQYDGDADEREFSPVAPFGWDESPQGTKERFYDAVLHNTSAYVSPSPQHVLYPHNGTHSAGSTVSFGSSSYSPYVQSDSVSPGAPRVPHQALQDRDYLSAANLHAVMISYLEEIFQYYDLAKSFTFAKVSEMVRSVPFAFRYIQGLVKDRLGISWHLVGTFVENVLDFISDEDIRDANVKEFADFLRSIQVQLYESMPPGNIFLNLWEFFHNVLAKFKKYLIQHWLEIRRIQFPCEFGKKSETLFLCMECHREHL